MALLRRITNLFRSSRVDGEIEAELKSHIEMRIEENIANGMSAEEARRDALVRFGNQTVTRERVAAQDVSLASSAVWRNARYAVRQLRRSPGFALMAILTLALGIGPNVAIFSIIWATFLGPIPYPHADQLVVVWSHHKGEREPVRGEDYAQLAAENRTFQRLDFDSWLAVHLTNPDHTEDLAAGLPASPGIETLTVGEPMALGRDFRPDEGGPGNDHFVILSHLLWKSRYNSDPNIVGKSILVQDEPYTVVGVTHPDPHERSGGVEFGIPIRFTPGVPSNQFGIMIGRLKPGVTLSQAQAELSVIDRRYAVEHKFGERIRNAIVINCGTVSQRLARSQDSTEFVAASRFCRAGFVHRLREHCQLASCARHVAQPGTCSPLGAGRITAPDICSTAHRGPHARIAGRRDRNCNWLGNYEAQHGELPRLGGRIARCGGRNEHPGSLLCYRYRTAVWGCVWMRAGVEGDPGQPD